MEAEKVLAEFQRLPAQAQRQVIDFIAFLKTRYPEAQEDSPPRKARSKITSDPFVGAWKDREDMADSTQWVRELRKAEWENRKLS